MFSPTIYPQKTPPTIEKLRFATATGEMLSSGCDCRVEGADANGREVCFKACRAPVANAVISVGEVTSKIFVCMYKTSCMVLPLAAKPVARFLRDSEKYNAMGGVIPLYIRSATSTR